MGSVDVLGVYGFLFSSFYKGTNYSALKAHCSHGSTALTKKQFTVNSCSLVIEVVQNTAATPPFH